MAFGSFFSFRSILASSRKVRIVLAHLLPAYHASLLQSQSDEYPRLDVIHGKRLRLQADRVVSHVDGQPPCFSQDHELRVTIPLLAWSSLWWMLQLRIEPALDVGESLGDLSMRHQRRPVEVSNGEAEKSSQRLGIKAVAG